MSLVFNMAQKTISQLLSGTIRDGKHYHIPSFQRTYCWGKNEREALWNDVSQIWEEIISNKKSKIKYFLGIIVLVQEENDDSDEILIIDGQQRITTLMLLLRAIFEIISKSTQNEDLEKDLEDIGKNIWTYNNKKKKFNFNDSHLVNETCIDKFIDSYKSIMSNDKCKENDNSPYSRNYKYFLEEVKNNNDILVHTDEVLKAILDRLYVITITCHDVNQALMIFNNINSKGKSLSRADILKAQLFNKYKSNDDKDRFIEKWKFLEETTYLEDKGEFNIDFLFDQLMRITMATGHKKINKDPALLKYFEENNNILNDDNLNFIIILAEFWNRVPDEFNLLSKKYLDVLKQYESENWKSTVSTLLWKVYAEYIKTSKADVKLSTILQAYREAFDKLLPILVSIVMSLMLNGKGTNESIKSICRKLNSYIVDIDIEKIDDLPSLFDKDLLGKINFPEYNKFLEESTKGKGANNHDVKFILRLYTYISSGYGENCDNAEIEHILPRKRDFAYTEWSEDDHKKYVEMIGNKILLEKEYNIGASNNFFANKCDNYYKDSNFGEAKKLFEEYKKKGFDWTKESIEKRCKLIYDKIKKFCKTYIKDNVNSESTIGKAKKTTVSKTPPKKNITKDKAKSASSKNDSVSKSAGTRGKKKKG